MKIQLFSIKNYRSIQSANIRLHTEKTVLLAQNNSGKSNILRAFLGAFQIISSLKEDGRISIPKTFFSRNEYRNNIWDYNWGRDYPKMLQARRIKSGKKRSPTVFRFDFTLDNKEKQEFKNEIGSDINGILPFEICIREDEINLSVPKRSYGTGENFKKNKNKIAKFISERLDSVYIPAIRTASLSVDIVEDLFQKSLTSFSGEDQIKYQEALQTILDIENKNLQQLSLDLNKSIKKILPNVKKISIQRESRRPLYRSTRYNNFDILINDGVETSLFEKGDGIKSLVALAIIRHSKESDKNLTLLLEEPETHLHPGAIKETKKILDEIAKQNQTIMTTHSPLFINRLQIGANIIIKENEAKPAERLSEIRECLGVAISDNLINSEVALLVEGKSDQIALSSILAAKSEKIKEALASNKLTIHPMGGLDHLIERKGALEGLVFKDIFVLVDADKEGRKAIRSAIDKNILLEREYFMTTIKDFQESEFEDYYNRIFLEKFEEINQFENWANILLSKKNRWTEKLKELYTLNARDISNEEISCLKIKIAETVNKADDPLKYLDVDKSKSLDAVVSKIERSLS